MRTLRPRRLEFLLTGILVLSLATAAFAAVKFKGGVTPSGTDNGLTLSMTVALSGLANADFVVGLSIVADPTGSCTNPAGATQPSGQNPAPVTVTGTANVSATQIKNGNATVTVTTNSPTSPIPNAPDCPNTKWTETITDMAFVSPATITYALTSNPSAVLFTGNCNFTLSPSTNGALTSVSCR